MKNAFFWLKQLYPVNGQHKSYHIKSPLTKFLVIRYQDFKVNVNVGEEAITS